MKKFIIAACAVVLLLFAAEIAYYRLGFYLDIHPGKAADTFIKTSGKSILIEKDGEFIPFEIRGVDMGVGLPGKWATDYAIDRETYLRWFRQIQEMGANTIRVYTLLQDDFYNAFYEYNEGREEPLYLLHGVWVDDYMHNSRRDAYDDGLLQAMLDDCRKIVDVLHGKRTVNLGRGLGSGRYRKDVSPWVLCYIVGVEWEGSLVAYTNQKSEMRNSYRGEYLYTAEGATAFEAMLCRAGDEMAAYESRRYKEQRLIAFSNWPTTDPFVYPAAVAGYRSKFACVNVEMIRQTEAFCSGMFASYHVYPYFPDYLELMREASLYTEEEARERLGTETWKNIEYRCSLLNAPPIGEYLQEEDYYDRNGTYNTYIAYLRALNRYHTLPVVISEYGVTTGRGMAQQDKNTNRNQGHMTEQEQGRALVACYEDIMEAGCAGSCVFSWQDEWFKRTWNTMHAVDLNNTPYWSDCQTNEQYFGLLAFDPGEEESVCVVDGDISEWGREDIVSTEDGLELSMKYDEKFIYFMVKKDAFKPETDTLYIPLDITPKSGSTYCRDYGVRFERECDFLVVIKGKGNSRVVVQKRYEALRSTYAAEYYGEDAYTVAPAVNTPEFARIYLPLTLGEFLPDSSQADVVSGEKYETGKLRYGNADPEAGDFDSLADFIFSGDYVELRLPWQLLNFSNPSEMMVHDDYYVHYGIENLRIDTIYAGIGIAEKAGRRIPMTAVPVEGWGKKVASHERLKKSYYILQEYWQSLEG